MKLCIPHHFVPFIRSFSNNDKTQTNSIQFQQSKKKKSRKKNYELEEHANYIISPRVSNFP